MIITYAINSVLRTIDLQEDKENDDLSLYVKEADGIFEAVVTAKKELTLQSAERVLPHEFSRKDLIFANGYQSWTETKEFRHGEHLNDLSKVPKFLEKRFAFSAYGSQNFVKQPKGTLIGFDLFYVEGKNPIFFGNRNYRSAYLMVRPDPKENKIHLASDVAGRHLAPRESFPIFHYLSRPVGKEGMKEYFAPVAPRKIEKHFGYTSWYNHYQNINEELMNKVLDSLDSRFDLFQIDDGFEPFVGDWMETDPKKFPNGLAPLVQKTHQRGMLAGIWLAPFVVEKNAKLYHEHPDYLAKDALGKPIIAGGNWSSFSPLDLNCPEAVDYIRWVLRHYVELGFDFFKLDFLYAVNLAPLHGKTRAETAEFAYALLREELEGKLILGCGATLSNGYGRFDYMRIGPDVSLKFDDVAYMRRFHPERISTKVTLCNTIFRYPMNGKVFGNDPDVFLLRDEKLSLSKDQRVALSTINALFGSLLMTSDNPGDYNVEKQAILEKILTLSKQACVNDYKRKGNKIYIYYDIDHTHLVYIYDMKKGVLRHGR